MVAIHWHATRGRRSRQRTRFSRWAMLGTTSCRTCANGAGARREREELAALDDRMLKDIGLTRADAEFLSNKPFWRE